MFFQHIYDKSLAQASYFIGCQKAGVAAVIDAKRDVESRHLQAFCHADLVVVLVKHPQIQHQQAEDNRNEQNPHPNGFAQPKQS